jgi:amidase
MVFWDTSLGKLYSTSKAKSGSWSRIDTNGIKVTSPSLDTIGFFARCITDLQLLASVSGITGRPVTSGPHTIESCRFAFVRTDQFAQHASEDLRNVWQFARNILKEAGAAVEKIELDHEYDNMGNSYEICDEQAVTSLLAEYRTGHDQLNQGLQKRVQTGGGISHEQAQIYRDHMATLRPKFDKIAREYDAIITPSCAGEAPKKEEFNPKTRFCGL